jgi:hypothetical protein
LSILFISMMQVKQISDNEIYLLIKYSIVVGIPKCITPIQFCVSTSTKNK